MRKFFGATGTVSRVTVESEFLKSNMLGDPTVRVVDIYIPAGHDGQGLPLLVDLVGFTGSGLSHTNWTGFRENLPERLDRLIGEQRMPPVVVAFPDCFTRLGGNQYINSASMGAWEDFLLHEMLPAIEQRFGCGGTGRRGVFGKSSGGYGAITHALRHSDIWSAAACHSGDMGFEVCYLPDMPAVLRALAGTENSIERWWQQLEAARKQSGRFRQGHQRIGDGGELRPGSDAVPRHPAAGHVRHLRGHRGALGELAAARPSGRGRNPGRQSAPAKGALHRLRHERPVQPALRRPPVRAAAERARRSRIATRSSPTTTPVSITGWTRACRFSPRHCPADLSSGPGPRWRKLRRTMARCRRCRRRHCRCNLVGTGKG